MSKVVRLNREDTILVAIDFQEKLLPAMAEKEKVEKNIIKLAKGLNVFEIPKLVTTQYARGLGVTTDEVGEALGTFIEIDKTTFSAYKNEEFKNALWESGRKTVIMTGIETHICVEQTTLDLLEAGYKVVVVADCMRSRDLENHNISVAKMAQAGATVTCTESILYELLGGAKAPEFKAISAIVK